MDNLTLQTWLALVGSASGWLFTLLSGEKDLPWQRDFANLLAGVLLAFAVADYVIPPAMPKLGLLAGLLCGAMGGYALLLVREMLPDMLRGVWDMLINRAIEKRKNNDD